MSELNGGDINNQWRSQDVPEGVRQPITWQKFTKNYVKIKDIKPGGGGGACHPSTPLGSANDNIGNHNFIVSTVVTLAHDHKKCTVTNSLHSDQIPEHQFNFFYNYRSKCQHNFC